EAQAYRSIGELTPSFSGPPLFAGVAYRIFLVASVAVVLAAGARAAKTRRAGRGFELGGPLRVAGLVAISLMARRNIALAAMGSAPFLGACLRTLAPASPPTPAGRPRRAPLLATAAVVVSILAASWFVASNRFFRWTGQDHEFGLGVLEVNFPIQ